MKKTLKLVCIFIAACVITTLSSCDPEPKAYTVTITDDGNGTAEATVGGSPATQVEEGATVTLTATPADGYVFDKWSAESGSVAFGSATAATTTFSMPASDVRIKAEFKLPEPPVEKYTITLTDDGYGTAAATIDGTAVAEAEEGATITLTATPADGYLFDKWTTETAGVTFSDAAASPATFTMPAGRVVIKAGFKNEDGKHNIAIVCDGEGTAEAAIGGAPVTEAEEGETITLTANPADGWLFLRWVTENSEVMLSNAAVASTTFTMPDANVKLEAEFIEDIDVLTKIPDANFMNHCKQYDTDKDGKLSIAEALAVTQIKATYRKIASLEGIEYFRNLTHLDCSMQSISNSPLTSLDLSKNTELVELNCLLNSLATLDLSKNTKLTTILTQQNKLTSIITPESDIITTLDVNQNELATLDVSKLPNLTTLMCSINKLTSLDLSKNTKLQYLFCSDNDLRTIDVSKNLELLELYCSRAGLTSVDVSKNEKLTDLQVQDNLLTSLDVSNNPELNFFYCYNNKITSLDVSNNPRLNNLKCWNNRMSELDVTNMRLDMGVFYVHCGNQTTDGTTPQTLTLTMREDMKAFYTKNLANAKDSETGYVYNANVVVAE